MTPVTELTALRQRMRQRLDADGGGVLVDTACCLVAVLALQRETRLIDGLASIVGQPTAQAWLQTIAVEYADDVGAVRTAYERLHADAVRRGLTADEAALGAWLIVVMTYISPDPRAAITPPATLSLAALRMRVETTLRALNPEISSDHVSRHLRGIAELAIDGSGASSRALCTTASPRESIEALLAYMTHHFGEEIALVRHAFEQLTAEGRARGLRGGALDQWGAAQVNREWFGRTPQAKGRRRAKATRKRR